MSNRFLHPKFLIGLTRDSDENIDLAHHSIPVHIYLKGKQMQTIIFCLFWFSILFGNAHEFPICSEIFYTANNQIDVEAMIYNCADQIPGTLFPPSFFVEEPTNVSVSLAFNTIIDINDVAASITIDVWLREFWEDKRWNLPQEMWDSLSHGVRFAGLELAPYINNEYNNLNFWLPDVFIAESITWDVQEEMVHLFQNGQVWWSRHIVTTLKQGQMDLRKYPADTQKFLITLQSWAYPTRFVILVPFPGNVPATVTFNQDPSLANREYFELNPVWTFLHNDQKFMYQPLGIFFDHNRQYSTLSVSLDFQRKSFGIVYRLALPVLMFLLLVGFAFWAELDHRVEITVTMVLAVSAFYLIIGQVIPLVGYFSIFDKFITSAFMILCFATGIHYVVISLDGLKFKHPFNDFYESIIVYICRIGWFPSMIFMALFFYFKALTYYLVGPIVIILVMTTGLTLLDCGELEICFRKCLCKLRVKHYYSKLNLPILHDNPKVKEDSERLLTLKLTSVEQIIFNLTYIHEIQCLCDYKLRNDELEELGLSKGFFEYILKFLFRSVSKVNSTVIPEGDNNSKENTKTPSEPQRLYKRSNSKLNDLGYSAHCVLMKEAQEKIAKLMTESNELLHPRRADYCQNRNCSFCSLRKPVVHSTISLRRLSAQLKEGFVHTKDLFVPKSPTESHNLVHRKKKKKIVNKVKTKRASGHGEFADTHKHDHDYEYEHEHEIEHNHEHEDSEDSSSHHSFSQNNHPSESLQVLLPEPNMKNSQSLPQQRQVSFQHKDSISENKNDSPFPGEKPPLTTSSSNLAPFITTTPSKSSGNLTRVSSIRTPRNPAELTETIFSTNSQKFTNGNKLLVPSLAVPSSPLPPLSSTKSFVSDNGNSNGIIHGSITSNTIHTTPVNQEIDLEEGNGVETNQLTPQQFQSFLMESQRSEITSQIIEDPSTQSRKFESRK